MDTIDAGLLQDSEQLVGILRISTRVTVQCLGFSGLGFKDDAGLAQAAPTPPRPLRASWVRLQPFGPLWKLLRIWESAARNLVIGILSRAQYPLPPCFSCSCGIVLAIETVGAPKIRGPKMDRNTL